MEIEDMSIGEVQAAETAKLMNLYGDEFDSSGFLEVAAEAAERLLRVARNYHPGAEYRETSDLRKMLFLMEQVEAAVTFLDAPIKKAHEEIVAASLRGMQTTRSQPLLNSQRRSQPLLAHSAGASQS